MVKTRMQVDFIDNQKPQVTSKLSRSTYDKFLANLDDVVYISNKMLCSGGKKTDSCKGNSSSIMIKGFKKNLS